MQYPILISLALAAAIHAQDGSNLPSTDSTQIQSPKSSTTSSLDSASSTTAPSTTAPSTTAPSTSAPSSNTAPSSSAPSRSSATLNSDGSSSLSLGSLSLSQIESQGTSATRIAWRPEFSVSKLGIALDMELFLKQGQISSEGWNFDTQDQILNTLMRKIYYVRWDKPGASFYARAGALESINLDAGGLITRNYGNSSLYPSSKPLGTHIQFNDWTALGLDLEAFTNSWKDWNNKGGVLGTRAAIRPLKFTGIPVVHGLKLGVNFVKDFNQFADLNDRDRDGCPDDVDQAPNDASTCTVLLDHDRLTSSGVDSTTISKIDSLLAKAQRSNDNRLKGQYSQANAFGMIGFDARLPILDLGPIQWEAYSAVAFATEAEQLMKLDNMGLIPLGSSLKIGLLNAKLESRWFQNKFKSGHFGADYDMQRTVLDSAQGRLAILPYGQREFSQNFGERFGFMGEAMLDLGGFAEAGGTYSQMNPVKLDTRSDRNFELRAELGQAIVQMIPKLDHAKAYYQKDHIGLGLNSQGQADDFFDLSSYTTWGYSLGIKASDNFIVSAVQRVAYVPNGKGIKKIANFGMETQLQF